MRFTKDQMRDELQTLFLFEADHILLGAGEDTAAAFIGFSVGEEQEYCFQASSKVDLARFKISDSFERGYDYAFRPSVLNSLGEHEVQDLVVFMLNVPRAGGITSGGETHRFMTPDGYCQTVADTVQARWKLEWDSTGAGSHEFTPRELALLANMTEGAVRNAVADKSENGLKAIPGKKNPIKIEHDEAWRWLNGRRGFIPSPKRSSEDRFLTEHLRDIQSSQEFGNLVERQLWSVFGSPQAAPSALRWATDEIEQWCNGTFEFDEARARQLAEALDLDVPLFAGKALEVRLRRNMPPAAKSVG